MSWDEVKGEKEGYLRVRKSEDRALIGRLRKENDDPQAKGYIELKVDDLGGLGGSGGGPHTHSEYAPKTHTHDEYLTDLPDHSHPEYEGGSSYDDTQIKHDIKVEHDKNTQQDQRIDNMATQGNTNTNEITKINNHLNSLDVSVNSKAPADHTHDNLGGGTSYDDSEVRDLIQGNADAIAEIQTKGYDDTELSGRVSDTESKNTKQDERLGALEVKASVATDDIADLYALSEKKADSTHTHDAVDLTHDHNDAYADKTTTNQILNAMATDIDSLETKTYNNQEAIKSKADSDHTHDAPDLTHEHEGMVTSASVTSIVRLSQAEFDALADKDSSTLYLVV